MTAKRKLRPSQDVYHRIRWDPALDLGDFELDYRDRSGVLVALPLTEFVPGGRIPWSRVYRVRRRDGVLVWDRETRRDLLFGSGNTDPSERLDPPPRAEPDDGFLVPLPVWRHGPRGWREVSARTCEPLPRAPLSVISYNVLFDRFRAEGLRTAERRPAQLALLEASGADLIALQEVTPEFLAALLAAPWVQRGYCVSAGPESKAVAPHGQLLLSRVAPAALGLHAYSGHKQVLVARFADGVGGLWVSVLHLTSNLTPQAPKVREGQLASLRSFLERSARAASWLLVGDFNQADGEPDGGLAAAKAVDLWPALYPDRPGPTFDPSENPLAAALSGNPRPVRYDRMLLRAPSDRWRATRLERIAREPAPGVEPPLYLSDHFGLRLELAPGDGSRGDPVHTTALALVPPPAAWPTLQAIREAHDPRFERWPPHVSVLYGFVPEPHLQAAAPRVRAVLARHAPLQLQLREWGTFSHRKRASIWLRPESAGALRALQADLEAEFPACTEQSQRGADGYTPHLTVGQSLLTELPATLTQLRAEWVPLEFEVDALCTIARSAGRGFDLVSAIPLGQPRSLEQTLTRDGPSPASQPLGLAELQSASPVPLALLGSWALGCALESSDVDVWAQLPAGQSAEGYYGVLTAELESQGRVRDLRVVPGDAPLLRVDLELSTGLARLDVLASCEPPSQAAAAERLRAAAGDRWPQAVIALRALRAWAHARQLGSQAFGGLGGIAWAALAVDHAQGEPLSPGALVERCLAALAIDGAEAVTSAATRLGLRGELAKGLTPSTRDLLTAEALRGQRLAEAACAGRGAWSGLLFPTPRPSGPTLWVVPDPAGNPRSAGHMQGVAQRLISELEASGAAVRPYPQRTTRGWAFGLSVLGDAQKRAAGGALRVSRDLRWEAAE